MKVRTILEGCGAGILIMLPYAWPQLSPYHTILYHSLLPSHTAAWGTLIDLVGISALAAFLLCYLERKNIGFRSVVWSLIAARFAVVLLYLFVLADVSHPQGVVARANSFLGSVTVFGAIFVVGLIMYRFWPPAYQSSVKVLRLLLLLVGFSIVWMVPELLYLGLVRQPVESTSFKRSAPGADQFSKAEDSRKRGRRRIVWLLFDELSYHQTFDHPYPGVALPMFDELKRESVSFEALRPVGDSTERVVPSFFLGNVVDDLKSDLQGRAQVKLSGKEGWRSFDDQRTLFSEAQQDGWTTGVVGWFNPYCRILAGSLDSCFWRPSVGQLGGFVPYDSPWESALTPVRSKLLHLAHGDTLHRQDHEDDLNVLMQHAQALIQNENIRFAFIHLPVPHPPGIYDRKTGQVRESSGTYIDNLVLADRSLGKLMSILNATPSASQTTLIICSDHSWRVYMWRPAPGWTKEEEVASQGRFEPRPVLMIHFPGQSSEVPIAQPFDEIKLHDILLQMLEGDLNSPAELTAWLQGNPTRQQKANNLTSGDRENSSRRERAMLAR